MSSTSQDSRRRGGRAFDLQRFLETRGRHAAGNPDWLKTCAGVVGKGVSGRKRESDIFNRAVYRELFVLDGFPASWQ